MSAPHQDEAAAETEALAAQQFEPVDNGAMLRDFTQPIWGEMIADLGIDLRLAACTVGQTKPELVTMVRGMLEADDKGEALFTLIERFGDTGKRLKSFCEIVDASFWRLQIAASAVAMDRHAAD